MTTTFEQSVRDFTARLGRPDSGAVPTAPNANWIARLGPRGAVPAGPSGTGGTSISTATGPGGVIPKPTAGDASFRGVPFARSGIDAQPPKARMDARAALEAAAAAGDKINLSVVYCFLLRLRGGEDGGRRGVTSINGRHMRST